MIENDQLNLKKSSMSNNTNNPRVLDNMLHVDILNLKWSFWLMQTKQRQYKVLVGDMP